jgi:hypothetical protein
VKFKLIFALFNAIIIISFLIILFMPLIMLGPEYSATFWSSSWYLPILFFLIIAVIDGYFLLHWRLLVLLEKEDWSALVDYLEDQIYNKGHIRTQFVRTLINAYFVTSRVSSIEKLENTLREKKPKLLRKFALQLGIPKILHDDAEDLISFFGEFKEQKVPRTDWVRFLYAFGILMKRRHSEGREELLTVSKTTRDPVLQLVTLYTLEPFRTTDDEVLSRIKEVGGRLAEKYSREKFRQEIEKRRENVVVLVLSRLIDDSLDWLYGDSETAEASGDGPAAENQSGQAQQSGQGAAPEQ